MHETIKINRVKSVPPAISYAFLLILPGNAATSGITCRTMTEHQDAISVSEELTHA